VRHVRFIGMTAHTAKACVFERTLRGMVGLRPDSKHDRVDRGMVGA
jgi:hypothetical protein